MTSWVGMRDRDREWGVLGKLEGFRVPYKGADGIVAVFPRLENGGLEVMVGLEREAMVRMVTKPDFVKYAEEC
jgi:hypothetical protein